MTGIVNSNRVGQESGYQSLASVFALGFKFLVWINGLGVVLVLFCALDLIPTDLTAFMLRLPLAMFLAGLAFCGVGLLWSYLVQVSLFNQLLTGHARRTHWIPMFFAMLAYSLSMIAFVAGCWFTLNLTALVDWDLDNSPQSEEGGDSPLDQSGPLPEFRDDSGATAIAVPLALKRG